MKESTNIGVVDTSALAALERFVVDNDDLLSLEERIGRFNIFDALRIERMEIRHSNFLSWLLDPAESHGQGSLFLKSVLMDLLKQAPSEMRPMSPVEIDGEELRGVEIRREWNHIDLLIKCDEPAFVIGIENKIDSGEGKDQLKTYKSVIEEHFSEQRPLYVFLTTDGTEPSSDKWVSYSYSDLHRVLTRVLKSYTGAIGGDVSAFLQHYLRLIESRFMDDPELDRLCQQIYKNHRQALELIFDRVGSPTAGLLQSLQDVLESQSDKWHIFNRTSRRIDFVPKAWTEWIPEICDRPKWHPQMWIRWWVNCGSKSCNLIFEIGPAKDKQLRRRVIEELVRPDVCFGCKVTGAKTDRWTRLRRESVFKWPEETEPDPEQFAAAFKIQIEKLSRELDGVPEVLKPVVKRLGGQ